MAWRQRTTEILADVLRFAIRGALTIDGIIVAVASVYVTAKFCWFGVEWLDKVLFSAPW